MEYYDCNIHLDKFDSPLLALKENFEFSVNKLVSLCDNPREYLFCKKILQNQKNISIGVGFHPNRLYNIDEINQMEVLMRREIRIFGECGLDYSNKQTNHKSQLELFKKQLEIAESKEDSIVIVHSRGAEKKILDILDTFKLNKVIFHWYSGEIKNIERIVERDIYFSYNMVISHYKKYIGYIEKIPLRFLLLESDAPFSCGKGVTQPEDFQIMTSLISEIKGIDKNITNLTLNGNFNNIFKF